ncbi:zinc-dependent alcohol dehydrogenase family protein [Brevundimonas sp.]|uniref:zinc-dependent alcohol dehydrogenase family protein n=1 Tax=Brevundimonas sp. TaxID=1871086 RepID=UPI002CA21ED4|nr:zinc-dependent alcohol dehydrogenase family protein [Brevundimonas sp.]HWQ85684.1 zinc-dependent alcohol dehydrogenase family protein [Brevundimonas sp.]
MALRNSHGPLVAETRPDPEPGPGQVRLRVSACGVCRTDLHELDGDLAPRQPAIIPGHEIVGVVDALGSGVTGRRIGERLGAAWLAWTCGVCPFCLEGRENLCDRAEFHGWTRDGGYADTVIADARYCFSLPSTLPDAECTPLLCAGLIGFRAWRMACTGRSVETLGLYGFGAAAHLLAQLALWHGQRVYAFVRPGDEAAAALARELGCAWAGPSGQSPPTPLDAAILFAPVGELVPEALRAVRKGGAVICGGIHMSDIPAMPYEWLWGERVLASVANLTRQDALDYFPLAEQARVRPHVTLYPLERANDALDDLRRGRFSGAAVLLPNATSD